MVSVKERCLTLTEGDAMLVDIFGFLVYIAVIFYAVLAVYFILTGEAEMPGKDKIPMKNSRKVPPKPKY